MADPSDRPPSDPPTEWHRLLEEAAHWVTRLRDTGYDPHEPYPDFASRKAACQEWLRQSEEHSRAFLQACEKEEEVREIFIEKRHETDLRTGAVVSQSSPHAVRRPPSRTFWGYGIAATVALTLAAALVVVVYVHPADHARTYSTKIGEVHEFTLDDGSHTTLDSNTQIVVTLTRSSRRVDVIKGNAYLSVAHDPARPFMTCVGGVFLTDVGTEFYAGTTAGGADVIVTSGAVEITGRCPSPGVILREGTAPPPVLKGGEQADITVLSAGLDVRRQARTQHEMDVALTWRYGVLTFENTSLGDAITHINCYLPGKLVLANPKLGEARYGGTFKLSSLEGSFLSSLRDVYGIVPDPSRSTPTEILLVPEPGR